MVPPPLDKLDWKFPMRALIQSPLPDESFLFKAFAQWLRDIIAGGRDGLKMQDRYEVLSRMSDWELARRGLTRADIARLAVDGEW
jgi:hypothetical protein